MSLSEFFPRLHLCRLRIDKFYLALLGATGWLTYETESGDTSNYRSVQVLHRYTRLLMKQLNTSKAFRPAYKAE